MASVTPSDLRAEIVTDFSRLEALADDWERLRAAGRRPEAFQTFGWARAAWRTLERERTLATVVVYAGTEVAGVPLTLEGQTLGFLASRQSDYNIDAHWVAPARGGDEADFLRQVADRIKKTA